MSVDLQASSKELKLHWQQRKLSLYQSRTKIVNAKRTEAATAILLYFTRCSKKEYKGIRRYAIKKLKSITEKKAFVIYIAMAITNIVTTIVNLLKLSPLPI
ncbi:hypothetical protein A9239_13030 [Methanosarcina sp. A14]|nr:hypothetical protein A9239_13030 [Methanosarcina sp. A14]